MGGCPPAHRAEALLAQLGWDDGGGGSSFPLGYWGSPAHRCLSVLLRPRAQVCVLFVCMEMSFLWADGSAEMGQGIIQVPLPAIVPLCSFVRAETSFFIT